MIKILVVEDNHATLDFYREFFSDAGFEIKTAEDAFSAITLYQQFKPDLIILDLGIPAGGGMRVFKTLRTSMSDPAPIIFCTAKPEELPNLSHIHNVAVLGKPVAPDVLMAEVKRLLPKTFDRPLNPAPPPPPGQPPAGRRRILAVDMDPRALAVYAGVLSKAGFETRTAADADGAVAEFVEFRPEVLILDADLPAGGGRKVFERLRLQLAASTPVIFSTATLAGAADLENNLGVLILRKPLTPGLLVGAVRDLLKLAS